MTSRSSPADPGARDTLRRSGWLRVTLASRLEAAGNRPSGFDYLRVGLAVSIILWHTVFVCYGAAAEAPFWSGWTRPLVFALVPSFFALSGFLVAGSLTRNRLPAFLTLRALRIYPALAVEVLISALIIGPALTTVSLGEYFASPTFHSYLLNAAGYIHYELPGVFLDNPAGRTVNQQLWTVPYELECYIAITVLVLLGILRRPALLALAILVMTLHSMGKDQTDLLVQAVPPGRVLILTFLSGVLAHLWRHRIPAHPVVFLAALAASWVLLGNKDTATVSAVPVAYVTIWLGLCNPRRNILIAGADYSYGIYLYGFAVQQAVAYLLPEYRIWYVNAAISLVVAGGFAWLSWHYVELPVMRRKDKALRWVTRMTEALRGIPRRLAGQARPGASGAATMPPAAAGDLQAR